MQKAVITSTIRTPRAQVEAMYAGAQRGLDAQKTMYGRSALIEIVNVYANNSHLSRASCIEKMEESLKGMIADGKSVSRHMVSEETFLQRNVFDIGVNSTRAANPDCFHPQKFTAAISDLKGQGVISHFIDERSSNGCWHIEIAQ